MSRFTDRMIGAARLEVSTYEEVEHDSSATGQALGVVVLAALAAGIGTLLWGGIGLLIHAVIGAIVGWAVWAFIIWLIGTKLLPEPQTEADWGQLARTTGFAQSPGLIRVFGFIPVIGPLLNLIAFIWMLVAMVIAVRQALDYKETWRAVVVALIGWVANVAIFALLSSIGGPLAAPMHAPM